LRDIANGGLYFFDIFIGTGNATYKKYRKEWQRYGFHINIFKTIKNERILSIKYKKKPPFFKIIFILISNLLNFILACKCASFYLNISIVSVL
jgi:hypothetical protein